MDNRSDQSNPSTRRIWYEVFLSFRGEDTRNNFIDHLYTALQRSGIFTFKDDQRLNKGVDISTELPKAIQESRISIVVFSKNYADSTWCLRELARIVDCYEVLGQNVLPIFYNVDPSEVRKQSGYYGEAFAKHEKSFKENLELVHTWRLAMSKIANLSGWDVRNKLHSKVVDEIVRNAISILGHKSSNFADDLVGIKPRVESLEELLDLNSNVHDVRVVGITGMGGIGKTTLAAVVYDRVFCQFDACSFLMDVSTSSKGDGLLRLQEQLLSETLKVEGPKIWNPSHGTSLISSRLRNLKTLLVLDNVNQLDELENLAKRSNWFGAKSRIIITTRDEQILTNYGVNDIYRVELLNDAEALELLCRKSFKHQNPMSGYEKVTQSMLNYVNGLPLAAKVLGSCLFNKRVSFWESTLGRLQENLEKEIMNVLRSSFDRLRILEQEIFLDIACFFHGMCTNDVKRILDCCGFHAESGISNLIDKSLLNIINKEVHMHDLLRQLGRNIVQEHFPKRLEKWSRLWLYKNFNHVMMERKVMEDIEVIVLNPLGAQETALRAEGLSNFSQLRLLIFYNVDFIGSLRSLSTKLKYLEWHRYPFTYFPSNFQLNELVELVMPQSCIKQLWEGIKPLHNLRSINLRHSKKLIKVPDFRGFPNLERLDLEGCTRLLKLDESIGVLANLTFLNLNNCKNLVSIPECLFCLSSLKTLCLSDCLKLQMQLKRIGYKEEIDRTGQSILSIVCKNLMLPFHLFSRRHKGSLLSLDSFLSLPYLKKLELSYCDLSEIPGSIRSLHCLEDLNLSGNNFITLPSINKLSNSFLSLPSLKKVDLSYCDLSEIPDSIRSLHCLEELHLSGNNFITLPSLKKLSKLRFLWLQDCEKLQSLRDLPSGITSSLAYRDVGLFTVGVSGYFMEVLNIFFCPMFMEIERCSSIGLSWLIKFLEENKLPNFSAIIVGSEIPRCLNHQSLGSFISIQIPPNIALGDSNWLGIAVCASFVARDFDPNAFSLYVHVKGVPFWPFRNFKLVKLGLSQLCILYFTQEYLFHRGMLERKTRLIEFKLISDSGFEIKKCRVRWVYKKGVERLERRVMYIESSIQIDDDDNLGIADSILKCYLHEENGFE